jgi:hypothetical protein
VIFMSFIKRLWHIDRPLATTAALMLVALTIAAVGLMVDPRAITGAPAWLKPAKFAISIGIYVVTIAWIFSYLPEWPRTRRLVAWSTAGTLVLEIVIINVQAWRGTTSHFNVGTALDGALFSIMGTAILVQTLAAALLCVTVWRQRFADPALGWALRLGLLVSLLGAASAGLMLRPTDEQLRAARESGRILVVGSHTVGAPDGGPGLPGTGWSTLHGDLRVAHLLGLHALQAIPLLALLLQRRGWSAERRTRAVVAAASGYFAFFVLLLSQALAGQSIVRPDTTTLGWLVLWAAGSAAVLWLAIGRTSSLPAHTAIH